VLYRRENANANLTLHMRRVPGEPAFHCEEGFAAQDDRMAQKLSILIAEIPEFRLIKPRGEGLTLGCWAIVLQTNVGMIRDIPKPLEMTGIVIVPSFLQAASRYNPFEKRPLVDQKDIPEGIQIGDALGYTMDAVVRIDGLTLVNVAAIVPERLRGAGIQEDPTR